MEFINNSNNIDLLTYKGLDVIYNIASLIVYLQYSYGEILITFEDYSNAIEKFETAKKLHFTPIETYIKLGKYQEALENYW